MAFVATSGESSSPARPSEWMISPTKTANDESRGHRDVDRSPHNSEAAGSNHARYAVVAQRASAPRRISLAARGGRRGHAAVSDISDGILP
jgi:hypothetical protein